MPKPKALVIYALCKPEECSPGDGTCPAVRACKKNILEQEEPFEAPVLFLRDMCVGCGDCVTVCPLCAIEMK